MINVKTQGPVVRNFVSLTLLLTTQFVNYILTSSVRITQLVERWSLDTEDPCSNPSTATEFFGCVLEQGTSQTLLLSTQVYRWVPVRDICQCTAAACDTMC